MTKNLTWKLVIIVGILLVFLFGIFGVPKDWSGKGVLAAITDRIHLGLDLRGGTHLILQVQVNDAVNVDSDNAVARLKEDMRTRKINYADIGKPDSVNHPEMIVVKAFLRIRPAISRALFPIGCRNTTLLRARRIPGRFR